MARSNGGEGKKGEKSEKGKTYFSEVKLYCKSLLNVKSKKY